MSVQLGHTTASSAVSTLLEDSDVNVTQAFNSTLIKPLVLVCSLSFVLQSCFNSFFIDIDECAANTDGCDQLCTNIAGSFQCSCNSGYSLASNGRTCFGKLCVLK